MLTIHEPVLNTPAAGADDLVAIGSTVAIRDLRSGELDVYTLVLPAEADIAHHKVSSFTPIGRAIHGRRVGETVEFDAPAGKVKIRIEALHADPQDAEKNN